MKEQTQIAILPELPIVGTLKLTSRTGQELSSIEVIKKNPASDLNPFFKDCHQKLSHFLSGKSRSINIPLDNSSLSAFQLKVLRAMAQIPYGEVSTYKDIANAIKSKGYQAVGSACGKNPFMLIYPCHRVVGSNDLGGFAHGLKMKKSLLSLEGLNIS